MVVGKAYGLAPTTAFNGIPISPAQLGLAGALLLILGHALMKTGAFIGTAQVASMVSKNDANDPDDISNYAGLVSRAPVTALCMLIFMFALAGIPPTAGYFGKFVLASCACYPQQCSVAGLLSADHQLHVLEGAGRPEDGGAKRVRRSSGLDDHRSTLHRHLPAIILRLGSSGSSGSAASVIFFSSLYFLDLF